MTKLEDFPLREEEERRDSFSTSTLMLYIQERVVPVLSATYDPETGIRPLLQKLGAMVSDVWANHVAAANDRFNAILGELNSIRDAKVATMTAADIEDRSRTFRMEVKNLLLRQVTALGNISHPVNNTRLRTLTIGLAGSPEAVIAVSPVDAWISAAFVLAVGILEYFSLFLVRDIPDRVLYGGILTLLALGAAASVHVAASSLKRVMTWQCARDKMEAYYRNEPDPVDLVTRSRPEVFPLEEGVRTELRVSHILLLVFTLLVLTGRGYIVYARGLGWASMLGTLGLILAFGAYYLLRVSRPGGWPPDQLEEYLALKDEIEKNASLVVMSKSDIERTYREELDHAFVEYSQPFAQMLSDSHRLSDRLASAKEKLSRFLTEYGSSREWFLAEFRRLAALVVEKVREGRKESYPELPDDLDSLLELPVVSIDQSMIEKAASIEVQEPRIEGRILDPAPIIQEIWEEVTIEYAKAKEAERRIAAQTALAEAEEKLQASLQKGRLG